MTTAARAPFQQLIGGSWTAGGNGSYGVVNPATEEVVAEAPEASDGDVRAAIDAAAGAFPAWSRTDPAERARLLRAAGARLTERTPELLPLVIAETGATARVGSLMQIPVAISRFERYAKGALTDLTVPIVPQPMAATPLAPGGLMGAVAHRVPVGVVGAIAPYNFPTVNMVGKIAPALAVGCTVVMKPPPQDPLCVIELARVLDEVGFPPGVVNIVTGSSPQVGQALVENPAVDMISFTGSTTVGQAIYAAGAPTMKRLLMELGGKGAAIVLEDATVDKAVEGLASVWAFHSGQICTAPTRAIIHRSRYDEVVSKLAAVAPTLKIGDPRDPATQIGPVISATQRDRIESHIDAGVKAGAELVVDGRRPEGLERGYYVGPTLLGNCTNDMTVVRQEIFGPVIVALPYDTDDEAVAMANDSDFGLYSYVFGTDTGKAYEVARQIRSGRIGINSLQPNNETPFGGFKQSGIGRDGGDFGLQAYTELQAIIWPG
jgi:acyl-CoA reductase-like NAD-dependent aldehyde dehydrogenase